MASTWRKLLVDAAAVITATLLLFPAVSLYQSVRPDKFVSTVTPRTFGLAYEPVSLTTADGVRIAGWYIPRQDGQAGSAVIALHGYPADKGDILSRVIPLADVHDILLIDFRYFGESGGSISAAGARETGDLLAAVDHLKSRGAAKIGVYGFSMGGAVALMALDRTDKIDAVAAEGAYANLGLVAEELYRNFGPLKKPLAWLTGLYAKLFLGIDPAEVSPAAAAGRSTEPILLIHSRGDAVVPFRHAHLLQAALAGNPRAEFYFTDGLHGESTAELSGRLSDFFGRHLEPGR